MARAITSTVDHADIRGLVTALLSSVAWACPHSRHVHRRLAALPFSIFAMRSSVDPSDCVCHAQKRYPDIAYGHKVSDESFWPYEVDYLLSWLDEVPLPAGKHAAAWRESVRAFHSSQGAKRAMAVGQVWRIHAGYNVSDDRCELIAKQKRGWVD